jgi:hypothetical protein
MNAGAESRLLGIGPSAYRRPVGTGGRMRMLRTVATRWIGLIGLLALVPVALFALARSEPVVALSAVCVLLIVASLVTMFRPVDAGDRANGRRAG